MADVAKRGMELVPPAGERETLARADRSQKSFRPVAVGILAITAILNARPGAPADVPPLLRLPLRAQLERVKSGAQATATYRNGLTEVLAYCAANPNLFPPQRLPAPRMLPREQRERVWSTWRTFLDYILALDAVGKYYRDFYLLDGELRSNALVVTYAAFLAQYRSSLELISLLENDPGFDVLLNEPVPELGLPGGSYASLKFRFLSIARAAEFGALEALDRVSHNSRFPELRAAIAEDSRVVWIAGRGKGELLTAANGLSMIRRAGVAAFFPIQAGIAEWMGDTKVVRVGRSLISTQQVESVMPYLEPGDILIERREWYLSNIGLPGYWPHAALFVGTPSERYVYFNEPEVQAWVRAQGQPDGAFEALLRAREPQAFAAGRTMVAGVPPRVLEAMSEGVVFTTVQHSAAADSLAVLRPRLGKREKAVAILRAFHYWGRPYDFNFDFSTDSTLVCTELVYKAYEPSSESRGLRLPILEVLGRPTLPANHIVALFDYEYGREGQQLDLVYFLDGNERVGRAYEAPLTTFRLTWKRPKWHILRQ